MKQQNNKCVTKITGGALALLLASGCIIGNSKADNKESVQGEGSSVTVGGVSESQNSSLEKVGKTAPTTVKEENKNKDKDTLQAKINLLKEKLSELTKIYATDAGYNDGFKTKAKDIHDAYSEALNNNPTIEQLDLAIPEVEKIISESKNNEMPKKLPESPEDEQKNGAKANTDKPNDNKVNKNTPAVSNEKPAENKDNKKVPAASNEKPAENKDDKNVPAASNEKPAESKDNKNAQANSNEKTNKNHPSVPGENDSSVSIHIKDKIAGEINKFKSLLNDGSWTEESIKLAKNKINKLELVLMSNNLTEKDLSEVKANLNDIQINILKKKAKPSYNKKIVNNTVIRTNSNNVQTGVESLSSVLITLSASSLALFTSKKRK